MMAVAQSINIGPCYEVQREKISQAVFDNQELDSDYIDIYNLYADYLENNCIYSNWPEGQYEGYLDEYTSITTHIVYSMEYIDEDNIPELVYGGDRALYSDSDIYILKIENGDVIKYGPFGHYNTLFFVPKENVLSQSNLQWGINSESFFSINDNSINYLCNEYESIPGYDENEIKEYYINDKQTTKENYDSYKSRFIGKEKEWSGLLNYNNYCLLNDYSLRKLREGIYLIKR